MMEFSHCEGESGENAVDFFYSYPLIKYKAVGKRKFLLYNSRDQLTFFVSCSLIGGNL